jgi:cellulose synthase/poly-beta-1,6-N-acetylglucosamine synthase-like glycosyltransferase
MLLETGGFSTDSWTEDYELMFRLHQVRRHRGQRCQVMVHPGFLAQTKAPSNLRPFLSQRRRWAGGFAETHLQHRRMVGDGRLGVLGMGHLVHNILTLMQPLVFLVLIPLLILSLSSVVVLQESAFLGVFLLSIYAIYAITAIGRLKLYRHHVGHCPDSYGQLAVQLLSQFFLFRPLVVLGQIWGFSCALRRQRSW